MADRLSIAVCGAGIGGLASAILLSRAGHAVTVFERFGIPRAVGSGFMLQPTGMAVLDALGLADAAAARGAWIDRLFGRSQPSGSVVLDVRYAAMDPAYSGLAIQRAALFDILYGAVLDAPVTVAAGRAVAGSSRGHIRFEDGGTEGPFDLIVDALGVRSTLSETVPGRELDYGALWATLDWPDDAGFAPDALEQRYFRASQMAGVLPVGTAAPDAPAKATFFWSLRSDLYPAWRAMPLEMWKDAARTLWPETEAFLAQIDDHEALTFASYRHRTLPRPYTTERVIHIGDSYHAASPQLGQGANMALLDAMALARAVGAEGRAEIGPHYAQLRQGHVRLFQTMSHLFTPVYQSDSRALPVLRDRIVGPLSRVRPAPHILGSLVTGLMGKPLERLGLEAYRRR